MINILLVYSNSMSTSLLVTKMKKAAQLKNIEVNIWEEEAAVANLMKADVILIGPKARHILAKVKEEALEKPIGIIDIYTYGKMDGKIALENALKLLE